MGITERHWFENEEPELTDRQLEDVVSIQDRVYRRGYYRGYSDGVKEQKEKMEHLNNITLEYEKEVLRLQTLLKEQEAVVHPEPSCEMTYITDCCCDLCGVQLIREDNFCRCCGKRIEWEGR